MWVVDGAAVVVDEAVVVEEAVVDEVFAAAVTKDE